MTPAQKARCQELSERIRIGRLPTDLVELEIAQFTAGYTAAIQDCKAELDVALEALEYYAKHPSVIAEAYHSNDEKQITCVHTFINHVATEALAKLKSGGAGESVT